MSARGRARVLVVGLVVGLGLGLGVPGASAQPAEQDLPGEVAPAPVRSSSRAANAPDQPWGDGNKATPSAEPAKDAPYNVRQMAFAAIIMLVMGGFLFWLVKRNTRRGAPGA